MHGEPTGWRSVAHGNDAVPIVALDPKPQTHLATSFFFAAPKQGHFARG